MGVGIGAEDSRCHIVLGDCVADGAGGGCTGGQGRAATGCQRPQLVIDHAKRLVQVKPADILDAVDVVDHFARIAEGDRVGLHAQGEASGCREAPLRAKRGRFAIIGFDHPEVAVTIGEISGQVTARCAHSSADRSVRLPHAPQVDVVGERIIGVGVAAFPGEGGGGQVHWSPHPPGWGWWAGWVRYCRRPCGRTKTRCWC